MAFVRELPRHVKRLRDGTPGRGRSRSALDLRSDGLERDIGFGRATTWSSMPASGDVNVVWQSPPRRRSANCTATVIGLGRRILADNKRAATIGDDTSIMTNGNIAITLTNMTTGSEPTTSNGTPASSPISSPAKAGEHDQHHQRGDPVRTDFQPGNVTAVRPTITPPRPPPARLRIAGQPTPTTTGYDPATATVGPGSAIQAISGMQIAIQSQIGLGGHSVPAHPHLLRDRGATPPHPPCDLRRHHQHRLGERSSANDASRRPSDFHGCNASASHPPDRRRPLGYC